MVHFQHFVLLQCIYVLIFMTRFVIHAGVSLHTYSAESEPEGFLTIKKQAVQTFLFNREWDF